MRGVENQSKREAKNSKVIQKELEEHHRVSPSSPRRPRPSTEDTKNARLPIPTTE